MPYKFKIGMYVNELRLPLGDAIATAKEMGADYPWFTNLDEGGHVGKMSDAEADKIAELYEKHDAKMMQLSAGSPFKFIDLVEVSANSIEEHPTFKEEFSHLIRSMELAKRMGTDTVAAYTFAWPGEYTADKPTWPMRWATQGGIISEVEMGKLVQAFKLVAEQADRYDVDVSLAMMPWNYTNTTLHFRELAERVGSDRLKVMWGPADNYNCGEPDVATAGFSNVHPHVDSIHIKDLRVNDGASIDFDYVPFGEGDVPWQDILHNLREANSDAVLSLATHFEHPKGRVAAMQKNMDNLQQMIASL
tara:strand:+ start:2230 stop:3144 length:915 start_codon:yes stop_codon:yes gene_type:complete